VYAAAGVLILKLTVVPTLTLMSVAKPWMLGSPAPETSHTLGSVPGSWFSHTIAFPVQPAASASWPATPIQDAETRAMITTAAWHAGAWSFLNSQTMRASRGCANGSFGATPDRRVVDARQFVLSVVRSTEATLNAASATARPPIATGKLRMAEAVATPSYSRRPRTGRVSRATSASISGLVNGTT